MKTRYDDRRLVKPEKAQRRNARRDKLALRALAF